MGNMGKTSKYLIYGLFDPRNGELRYIGKSCSGLTRPKIHGRPKNLSQDTNKHKVYWISQLALEGLKPEIFVLEEFDNKKYLGEEEQFYIAYFKGLGCRLVNLTRGGDGAPGYRHTFSALIKMKGRKVSKEARDEMSRVRKGRTPWMKGKRHTQDTLVRISESKKGVPSPKKGTKASEETCRKISEAKKGRPSWNRGHPHSDEHKANLSISSRKRYTKQICPFICHQTGKIYNMPVEAAEELGLNRNHIGDVLKGRAKTHGGYTFDYIDKVLEPNL